MNCVPVSFSYMCTKYEIRNMLYLCIQCIDLKWSEHLHLTISPIVFHLRSQTKLAAWASTDSMEESQVKKYLSSPNFIKSKNQIEGESTVMILKCVYDSVIEGLSSMWKMRSCCIPSTVRDNLLPFGCLREVFYECLHQSFKNIAGCNEGAEYCVSLPCLETKSWCILFLFNLLSIFKYVFSWHSYITFLHFLT